MSDDKVSQTDENKQEEEKVVEYRKKYPFDLVGRGVAGVDEMREYLDDTKVYFGLLQIKVGTGSFARSKNVFIHFNGDKHPKPLQRSQANKKLQSAKDMMSPWHAELVLANKKECTIDEIFSRTKNAFVADNLGKDAGGKVDLAKLKNEYKEKMQQLAAKKEEEQKKLEEAKRKLLEKHKEEERRAEEERLKAEAERLRLEEEAKEKERQRIAEEERQKRLEEERKREEKLRREREEQEERERKENEEKQRLEEEKKKLEEEKKKLEQEKLERKLKRQKEREEKKSKGGKRLPKKKKDDWSNDKPWDGKRVVACIHQETSPLNWAVFQPSDAEIIPMAYGHGDLTDLRNALREDQVQYGLMRLTFGEGRFRRSHWVFFLWTPDSMARDAPQRLRTKKINERVNCANMRGAMEKLIGPYGVSIVAEEYARVTLEEWILRVRQTVVVDGVDEFMNAESFRAALLAEKHHFAEMETERLRKKELQRVAGAPENDEDDDTTSVVSEMDNEDLDKETATPLTIAKDAPSTSSEQTMIPLTLENGNSSISVEPQKNNNANEPQDTTTQVNQDDQHSETIQDQQVVNSERSSEASDTNIEIADEKKKKKKNEMTEEMLQKELQSKLVWESVELVKKPEEDLCWILVEPRLLSK